MARPPDGSGRVCGIRLGSRSFGDLPKQCAVCDFGGCLAKAVGDLCRGTNSCGQTDADGCLSPLPEARLIAQSHSLG